MFSKILVVFVAVAAAHAQTIDCARSYVVKPGDVCDTISAANNASTYQLALVNPQINANCTNIFGGQNLCLGEVGRDCDQTYVIASGDSCWGISQTFGIELAVLSANNPNVAADCSNIYPGEVLCVAAEEMYA